MVPLPSPPSIFITHFYDFSVRHQSVQHRGNGGSRILVAEHGVRNACLKLFAHFLDTQWTVSRPQHRAAGLGQSPLQLPRSVFPTDQFSQLFAQTIIAKYVGQSHNRLLDCANLLRNVSALPQELSQIFSGNLHNFLNVRVAVSHKLLCSRASCCLGI